MADELIIKVLLTIASGSVSVGVFLLIGIFKKVTNIDIKLNVLTVEFSHLEEKMEEQKNEIEKLKNKVST